MTTRYKNVQLYVDPKGHKKLKKKLKKKGLSLSAWVRQETRKELERQYGNRTLLYLSVKVTQVPTNRRCFNCPKDAIGYLDNEPRCPPHLQKVGLNQPALFNKT